MSEPIQRTLLNINFVFYLMLLSGTEHLCVDVLMRMVYVVGVSGSVSKLRGR